MAGYKGHKAGSPRAVVRQCLDVNGEEKALELGRSLGIKENRLLRWFKRWSGVGHAGGKRRVAWKYDPEQFGVILIEGDEVSSVLWDNGVSEFLSNKHFVNVETPE